MDKDRAISAVLTDVDGTLVTKNKVLTERARCAVQQLRDRGIVFTITSGRPPFGMRMLVEPLGLTMPMAAFNGGVIVLPDLSVLDERTLPDYLLPALIDMIQAHGLDVFLFRASDWFVRSLDAPRVRREASTIQQDPTVVPSFDGVLADVVKVVGVSEDHPRVAACEAAVQQAFGMQVSAARSQPYYLDVTHPTANKGVVIERLSRYLKTPLDRIAAIGDQPNDVLMFERAGISIAMGNASDDVKRRAMFVTTSFADEGFANAIEQIVLPRAEPAGGPGARPTAWLHRLGQSVWLDHIPADRVQTRALERCIAELSVTGLTSELTRLEQAVAVGSVYDASITELARQTGLGQQLVLELVLDEFTQAADQLQPVHERSAGLDGWVSLAVWPLLTQDAAGAFAAARALFARAGRANLMIEIPGTPAGFYAIEEAIFAGIPVNATLLFSREQYLAAAEAFLRGIERRIDAGLPPNVGSVASVPVGPWDTAIADKVPDRLRARLGIAMAQRTYKAYRAVLHSPRWQRIYNAGARPQRLLWAGTETCDPAMSETMYINALTAQFTIIAMSESTLEAFADHGKITTLLRADGGDCEHTLAQFAAAGIDVYTLAARLQEEGTRSLVQSWTQLAAVVASKAAGSGTA